MPIGFFAPFPLVMMMPFMAAQSMMMGDAFGKGYQYGKRKISSMSNEQFNAMTEQDLANSISTDYRAIVPTMKDSIAQSREFQSFIISEMAAILRTLPQDIISGLTGGSTTDIGGGIIPPAYGSGSGTPAPGASGSADFEWDDSWNDYKYENVNFSNLHKTHNLKQYDNMTSFQISDAINKADGTLKSYLINLLRKKLNPTKNTDAPAKGITDENSIQTISFSYRKLGSNNRFSMKNITYRGNFRWHLRKLRQIKNALNQTSGVPKINFGKLINKYVTSISRTYNIKFSI